MWFDLVFCLISFFSYLICQSFLKILDLSKENPQIYTSDDAFYLAGGKGPIV
jgi:hypothetical protein